MNGIWLSKNFYISPNLNDENAPLARICLENIQITLQAKDGGTSGNFSPIEPDILTLVFFCQGQNVFLEFNVLNQVWTYFIHDIEYFKFVWETLFF